MELSIPPDHGSNATLDKSQQVCRKHDLLGTRTLPDRHRL